MEIKGCPVPRRGERNIFCPYYGDCLDYAVQIQWHAFNCSRCPYKSVMQSFHEYDFPTRGSAFGVELPSGFKNGIDTHENL
ncbi:MAG: hypothetical protein JRL30_25375 [Deltaproteobacteria bacterium]|nr:hypothetical protein [Deltaproteobacteria bacterium]